MIPTRPDIKFHLYEKTMGINKYVIWNYDAIFGRQKDVFSQMEMSL